MADSGYRGAEVLLSFVKESYWFYCSVNYGFLSAVEVDAAEIDVQSYEDHVISCTISGIHEQLTGITWEPATDGVVGYTLEDGEIDGTEQVSTLTITAAKLAELQEDDPEQAFTCSMSFEDTPESTVTSIQTITILSPSRSNRLL